jgi:multicomponent Na+:H+ antiporter subunit C
MILNIEYMIAMAVFSLGIYCLISKKNMIKKIIGLAVMTKGIHLFLISMGFRTAGTIPIITNLSKLAEFNSFAVDPLPQALVLTSIVIDLSITALALTLIINSFHHFKTINTDKIRRLRG